MSSGGSQQVGGAPGWLQDQTRGLFDWGSNLAQQPYTPYQGQRVANQSPLQQLAFGGMGNLAYGSDAMDAAGRQLTDTINGGGQNQYQQQVVDRVQGDATDAYNRAIAGTGAQFSSGPGAWGSDRHLMAQENAQHALARGLSEGTANVYSNDFNQERNRQLNASALAPQLWNSQIGGLNTILGAGGQQQGYEQALLNSLYGDFTDQRDYGMNQLGRFASMMGGNPSSNFGQSQPGRDPLSTGLGMAYLGNSKGGTGLGTSIFGGA